MSRSLPASIPDADALHEQLTRWARGGALWFFAVAVLSLIQSSARFLGYDFGLAFGLGTSEVFHALGRAAAIDDAAPSLWILVFAIVADVFVASFLLHAGSLARKGSGWAFVIGSAFYAADACLLLAANQPMSALFHACALAGMMAGAEALRRLRRLEQSGSELASAAA